MQNNEYLGDLGEDSVCEYLIRNGYSILCRNYRIRGGEIDIIAQKDGYLVFVEVKARSTGSLSSGFEAVTKRKQELIIKTAADYCIKNPNDLQPRFDIAQVWLSGKAAIRVEYIENAFDATENDYIF